MTRTDEAYNDGYADNLSFVPTDNSVSTTMPEPATLALLATELLTAGGVAWRRAIHRSA